MVEATILLNTIQKVQQFEEDIFHIVGDMDATRGRYILDAHSVMGLLSLDLSLPIKLVFHSDDEKEIAKFFEAAKKYEA